MSMLETAPNRETATRFKVMGGEGEIVIATALPDTQAVMQSAVDEVKRIEAKYSRYRDDSIVSKINAAAGYPGAIEVDLETAGLLAFAGSLHEISGGLFDITSGILRRAWDFRSGRLPCQKTLDQLLPLVDWNKVIVEQHDGRHFLRLQERGMEIDFGGFGKEYAADRAATILQDAGVRNGLVNLGGDIRVIGSRSDGNGWRLGIQHPRITDDTIAGIDMESGALATSGDYERFMVIDGERYCHIIDPRTGWPVRHWQSISVAAPICLAAGAMTTIAMLKQQDGIGFLQSQQMAYLAIDSSGTLSRQGL